MSDLVLNKYGQYEHPNDPSGRMSILENEAAILSYMSFGRRVLEIGTGLGVSADFMSYTAHSVTTVDTDEWVHENIKVASKNVTMLRELPPPEEQKFDFAFIDGDHSYESTIRDWGDIVVRVEPGSIVGFHDNNRGHPGVLKSLNEIKRDGFLVMVLDTSGKLTFVKIPR